MNAIQPIRLLRTQKKLRPIRIRPRIGHRHTARARMLQHKVLIRKLRPINTLPASSIALGEITTLEHELRNNAMEGAALVAVALLVRTQGTEVLCRHRHNIGSQLYHDASNIASSYIQLIHIQPFIGQFYVFLTNFDFEIDTWI